MSSLPPGIPFLASLVGSLLAPALGLYALRKLAEHHGFVVPTWAFLGFCISFVPLVVAIMITVRDRRQARDAYRKGARLAPRLSGKWPGNIDIMLAAIKHFESYVGEYLALLIFCLVDS